MKAEEEQMNEREELIKWQKWIGIGCLIGVGLLSITTIIFNSLGGIAIPFLLIFGIFNIWIFPKLMEDN